ncbi:hypothetical protein RRG08_039949 [Elysia crispata]|uniref:Uncharacterized protein n=1 Tax=Elysia crispata TaxID=231223 RepID=A0AAE1DCG9_9GAST|nr:hypothetical protein RRG08_039949 [Elysia crispata]
MSHQRLRWKIVVASQVSSTARRGRGEEWCRMVELQRKGGEGRGARATNTPGQVLSPSRLLYGGSCSTASETDRLVKSLNPGAVERVGVL